ERCPPKAEVTGSNPVGCASPPLHDLIDLTRKGCAAARRSRICAHATAEVGLGGAMPARSRRRREQAPNAPCEGDSAIEPCRLPALRLGRAPTPARGVGSAWCRQRE